jgi:hypothetical protein
VLAPESGNTGLTLTGIYNVLAALREGRAHAKEKTQHTQGLVGVLRELHDELDARAGRLRLARHGQHRRHPGPPGAAQHPARAEEAQGRVRWLRPAFQNPQNSLQKQELLPQEDQAPEADLIVKNRYQNQSKPNPPNTPGPPPCPSRCAPWPPCWPPAPRRSPCPPLNRASRAAALEERPAHPAANPGSPGPRAGRGHRMAKWRGGVMRPGPLAPWQQLNPAPIPNYGLVP